ncbi:MAG: beta-galactosidase trimerization domain-containing protein, partial [Candidatus Omnitrophica bacterium]|nr:beta-galactosidase trimerization domain-containing protein [Candidatus Omnitrophota bacterium]
TTEWGLFYGAPKNILEGRRKLSQGVWSEVSGGAVGINCWVWRLNSFRGNYVDTAGLPTLYGWELKNLVSDLQKFDHIILDGKREESEIRILFSDTTRCHDQDWIEGENSSLHVQATRNFYSFFLRYYQPARVIAEEAILEGTDLSNCRLLIVSAAEYLSEDLQKALIDYVKNGGNLLLDGNAGKFDNYGHPGNLLLKEAGIAPSFVKRKEIFLPAGDTFFVKKPEFAFAPSLFSKERGKALLNYAGGEPALVSVHVGKGKMLVNGAPFGLEYQIEYPESTIIMKEVMKEIDLGAKYICGDKNLIIREWEHKDSRYLICVYPKDKNLINEFLLKIKGNCKVIDYLVGAEIPSTFDGNYTSFSGLMTSPGGRVYQLKKLSSKKTSFSPERFTVVVKEVSKSNFSTTATSSLPYRGNLCIEEPKEIDGFFFQTTVISFSVDTGEAFLTVSKGKEKLKRKVEPGKDYVFSFKDTSFLVKCISVQFVYPLWMEVEIKKNKKEPVSSSCSFQKEGDKLLLSNGLVRLTIVPERGGKIIEYSTLPEKVNHLAGGGIEENEGQWPGSFFDQPFSYKIIKDTAKEIKVLLKMDHAVNDLLLKKLITIKKNEAKVDLGIEEYNYGNVSKLLSLCLHPELSIGGIADREDRFFIPTPEGLETPSYVRSRSNHYFTPKEGWACCCDKGRKVAYITSFFLDEVKTVYIWMGADRYNLELFTPKKKIESLKALSLHTELFLIKGISGVSSFREGITLYISLPNTFLLQDKEIRFTVEVGSAFLEKKRLNGKISLFKEGKMVKEIGEFSHDVSFEEPLEKEFSFSAKGLPDGVYEIIVSILDQQGKDLLSTRKELFLAGQAKKENTRIYENFKKRFERLRQRYPSKKEQLFDTFTLLEEFGSAVGENDKEKIRLEREKLQKALMAIE